MQSSALPALAFSWRDFWEGGRHALWGISEFKIHQGLLLAVWGRKTRVLGRVSFNTRTVHTKTPEEGVFVYKYYVSGT